MRLLLIVVVLIFCYPVFSQKDISGILKNELEREMKVLSDQDISAYYISYRVHDEKYLSISGQLGSITDCSSTKNRRIGVEVRVGDYHRDNTHKVDNLYSAGLFSSNSTALLPIDNDSLALEQGIWEATQSAYISAKQSYEEKQDELKENTELKESKLDNFSKVEPEEYFEDNIEIDVDKTIKEWSEKIKYYSGIYASDSLLITSDVFLNFMDQRKYFVSNEGSCLCTNMLMVSLGFDFNYVDKEGDIVSYSKVFYAHKPDELPDKEEIEKELKRIYSMLKKISVAPYADPYAGPAILSASAAGVFFHEIFGHRVEGHRLNDESDSHTFKNKLGKQILPKTISVTADPTLKLINGVPLMGTYAYDDQGVKSQKVELVKDGILNDFLMSRSPVESIYKSNGHGRGDLGLEPVARQSNLIITSNKQLDDKKLRKKLIQECKKQKKEYGYYFKEVVGGFTQTTRFQPDVFNIYPIEVYRVYVDGRPDELVRGINFIGTPLAIFDGILAAGDDYDVFNGICGAESGNIPVSAAAPSLLIKKIETQKTFKLDFKMPVIERPYNKKNSEEAEK